MEHQWAMGEEDFLIYQLYHFKSTGKIKKAMRTGWLWIGGAFLVALFGYFQDIQFIIIYGLIFGAYMAFFYLYLYKRRLLKYFKRHVLENYHERFDRMGTLQFGAEWLFLNSEFSEMKIKNSQIQHFTELPSHILLKLKYGEMVIIPKEKVATFNELYSEIEDISDRLDVPFFKDLSWKW